MQRTLTRCFGLFIFLALVALAQSAGAFSQYSTNGSTGNCASCHGDFNVAGQYFSKVDNVGWRNGTGAPVNLHDGHRNVMLSGDCDVCHSAGSRSPVSLFSSVGGTGFQAISCTGCHDGSGLRAYHVNTGASNCTASCHAAATPPGENALPPFYFTPDAAHPNKPTDPCNANGSESRVAPPAGLDNDGNLFDDASDPACAPANQKPTLRSLTPSTVSSEAVALTFTAVYKDADGHADLKTVDFLVSPNGGIANALLVRYFVQTNKLRIFNDAGTGLQAGSCTPGVAGTLQNSQGSIVCGATTATGAANTLKMKFTIVPAVFLAGRTMQLKMRAVDKAGAKTALKLKGSWVILPSCVAPNLMFNINGIVICG